MPQVGRFLDGTINKLLWGGGGEVEGAGAQPGVAGAAAAGGPTGAATGAWRAGEGHTHTLCAHVGTTCKGWEGARGSRTFGA